MYGTLLLYCLFSKFLEPFYKILPAKKKKGRELGRLDLFHFPN